MYTYRPSSSGQSDRTTPRTQDPSRKYSESAIGSMINSSYFPEHITQPSLPSIPSNQPTNRRRVLFQLSVLAGADEDFGHRKSLRVEVVKKSLKIDGQWEKESPILVEHKWEDWVDFREQVVARFPDTEQILPKLAKTSLFSSMTSSKKSMFHSNCKDLEQLMTALLSCSRSVLNSELVQRMFDTQDTRRRLPLTRCPSQSSSPPFSPDDSMDDDPFSKASPPPLRSDTFQHLELFKFPPLAEEEPQLSPTLFLNTDVNDHHPVIPHPYAAIKPVGPPELPSASRASTKTSNIHTSSQSQSRIKPTRPQTSDCPVNRSLPASLCQSASGFEGAVKDFRQMRLPQALYDPASQPQLEYRDRMGSLPVSPMGYSNVGAAPHSIVQRPVRHRPMHGRPNTSGSTTSLPRTGPFPNHQPSERFTNSPQHPANVLPSFLPPHSRPSCMERRLESYESDTRTIVGTPTQAVPHPPTSARKRSVQANTLNFDNRSPNHDSSNMIQHQILRRRSSKQKTDLTQKSDTKSPPGSKALSPSRLVKQRPGLRQFKSMQDIRSSARGTMAEAVPATPSILAIPTSEAVCLKRSKSKEVVSKTSGPLLSPEYSASADLLLVRGRGTRSGSLRKRALPFLDRAGLTLREKPETNCGGSKDTSPSLSPNRRLHSRQSGSSSNSSFGSISHAHTTSSSAFTSSSLSNVSSKQRRSDSTSSTGSLVLSEASATSPLQPITPGQIQSPVDVVINSNNTSLLETTGGTMMQYVYDPQKCRFVGQRTIPSAPFFPIPPIPVQKPSSGVGTSFTHDGIRHAVQRRPHTAAGAYTDQVQGCGDLDAPIMLEELKTKKKLAPALAPISTGGPTDFTKVKVTHATSGVNVIIRVPTSIGLAGLKQKVQSKLVDEAEVCLPPRWEFWVPSSGKKGSSQRVCSDSDLGKLLWNGASNSLGKITLKLV